MHVPTRHTFHKSERLCSQKLIEQLFSGQGTSIPVFPLRAVFMTVESEHLPAAAILISVPKKRFKRAVKRNRVKRQIREAYRLQKQHLVETLQARNKQLAIAFIWLDNQLRSSEEVHKKVGHLLQLISERIA